MAAAALVLTTQDPVLAGLVEQHGLPDRLLSKGTEDMFPTLIKLMLYQQLATKAAAAIHERFVTCVKEVTPAAVLSATPQQLRRCGLSNAKVAYVQDLASHFQAGHLSDDLIAVMDEDTLALELIKVKGIGRWTVDMFSMFHSGKMDVLPLGDVAVRKGVQALYTLKPSASKAELEAVADKWRPYRSLGSYYMWKVPTVKQVKVSIANAKPHTLKARKK